MIDRAGLAEFLRATPRGAAARGRRPAARAAPADQRLRREEVAALCHMSTDYYSRLERQRGPQPSEQMIASIAQGLHLSLDERDHLFRLAGHQPPARGAGGDHVSPGMLRILDRLADTPAEIVTELGETLRQTPARRRAGRRHDAATPGRRAASGTAGSPTRPRAASTRPRTTTFYSRMYASGLRGVARPARARVARGAARRPAARQQRGVPRPVGASTRSASARDEVKRFMHPERRAAGAELPDAARPGAVPRRCSSTPPCRAARATRSCSCWRSSARPLGPAAKA